LDILYEEKFISAFHSLISEVITAGNEFQIGMEYDKEINYVEKRDRTKTLLRT
jgi:hypothetical protein